MRANLFSGPVNAVVTIVAGLLALYVVYRLARWAFVTSDWEIVRANLRLFMVGRFPDDELWRPWVSVYVLALSLGIASGVVIAGAEALADAEAGQDPALAAEPEEDTGPWGPARRYWPLAVRRGRRPLMTRTFLPILTGVLVAVFVGGRAAGAQLPAGVRRWTWPIVVAGLGRLAGASSPARRLGWEDWAASTSTSPPRSPASPSPSPSGCVLALGRRSSLPGIRCCRSATSRCSGPCRWWRCCS